MTINSLMKQTAVVGLLFLSGCEAARGMRDDLARLTSAQPAAQKPSVSTAANRRPRAAVATTPTTSPAVPETPSVPHSAAVTEPPAAARVPPPTPQIALAGKSEAELRAMFGSPTRQEDRPPGKRWHYRDGHCTLDVQLYPDVQTKQFGTLAYEVKSDDDTDQGKRLCVAQLQARVQSGSN